MREEMPDLLTMRDKAALVTGATSGIGKAIAVVFAQHGATVVLTGRDAARSRETVEAIAAADVVAGDLRDAAVCRSLVDDTVARHGRLDALVNCAAVLRVGTADRIDSGSTAD